MSIHRLAEFKFSHRKRWKWNTKKSLDTAKYSKKEKYEENLIIPLSDVRCVFTKKGDVCFQANHFGNDILFLAQTWKEVRKLALEIKKEKKKK